MITRAIRKSFKRQEGQALVIACLMVLVLAIGVLTTVNLGHNIHERIRLQNTADAASYSMAAMEARAFNFYAFSNRTQVSHYVAAMTWQSLDSVLYFVEAWITDLLGFVLTLPGTQCADPDGVVMEIICPILENLPYVGPVIKVINTFLDTLINIVQGIQDGFRTANPDRIFGNIVRGMGFLNRGMAVVSQVVGTAMATHIVNASSDIIVQNDKNADPGWTKLISGAINSCLFRRTHFYESGVSTPDLGKPLPSGTPWDALDVSQASKKEDSKVSRAKRAMGAITNATRAACSDKWCQSKGFTTKRTLTGILPIDFLPGVVKDFIDNLIPKDGATRFLSYKTARGYIAPKKPNNFIRWKNGSEPTDAPLGEQAQPDAIGSDDIYRMDVPWSGVSLPGASFNNPFGCHGRDEKDDDEDIDNDRDKNDVNEKMEDYEECWGDQFTRRGDPPVNAMKTSIWALHPSDSGVTNSGKERTAGNNGGIHWRLNYKKGPPPGESWGGAYKKPSNSNDNYEDANLNSKGFCIGSAGAFGAYVCIFDLPWGDRHFANVRPVEDGNHVWDGPARFPHFEPGEYSKDCGLGLTEAASKTSNAGRNTEFNQPSAWLLINKSPDKLKNPIADPTATYNDPALLNDQGEFSFGLSSGSSTKLVMENNRKKFLGLLPGMSVISRAQTYYHRPGNWAEQPNFFNPYWRPRLASVWQGRYSLPLLGGLKNDLGGAAATGSTGANSGSLSSKAQSMWGQLKNLPQRIITH